MQTECTCGIIKKMRMDKRLKFANIPEAYKNVEISNFKFDVYKTEKGRAVAGLACKSIKFWLDNFQKAYDEGLGLYLFSKSKGSGKTRMAASIANYLINKKNVSVKFASSMQIINEIKSTWDNKEGYTENKLLDALVTAEVLIIDDFGTERTKDWICEKFYSIINGRYVDKKITIFTSNMSIDNLDYDDRITNRIKERCYMIPFPEESVREHIAEDMNRELRRNWT